jgi:hypothetical protein
MFTCGKCKTRLSSRAIERGFCPTCGKALIPRAHRPAPPPPSVAKPRGSFPGERAPFVGVMAGLPGKREITVWPEKTRWPAILAPFNSVGYGALLGQRWWYETATVQAGHLVVRAIKPFDKVTGRPSLAKLAKISPERFAKAKSDWEKLLPLPIGEGTLERMDVELVVAEIERLSTKKNDPFAWRELALGYRRKAISRPVAEGLRKVGVEKVQHLVEQIPGEWSDELIEFLNREVELKKKRKAKAPVAKVKPFIWTDQKYWQDGK